MKYLSRTWLTLVIIFLYLPIVYVIIASFDSSRLQMGGHFTWFWYKNLVHRPDILSACYDTFLLALSSSILSTLIASLASYGLYKIAGKGLRTFQFINRVPMASPDLIIGLAFLSVFSLIQFPLGFSTLLISHIGFSVPFALMIILPRMQKFPKENWEAALDLGASEPTIVFKIFLPEILPAIFSSLFICFTLSLDDFLVSFFTTGGGIQTLSILTYNAARKGIDPSIEAVSSLFFVVIFLLMLFINIFSRRSGVKTNTKAD